MIGTDERHQDPRILGSERRIGISDLARKKRHESGGQGTRGMRERGVCCV